MEMSKAKQGKLKGNLTCFFLNVDLKTDKFI